MVMVTGITCGAAVTAITTVGTEAADIIMDGTRADIADGIHNMRSRPSRRWGGLVYHGTLFNERDQIGRQSMHGRVAADGPPQGPGHGPMLCLQVVEDLR